MDVGFLVRRANIMRDESPKSHAGTILEWTNIHEIYINLGNRHLEFTDLVILYGGCRALASSNASVPNRVPDPNSGIRERRNRS